MIPSFPKIFAVGSEYIPNLFNDEVEVTEKVDGSQFAFSWQGDHLECRSKGAIIEPDFPPKMFELAVEAAKHAFQMKTSQGWYKDYIFYCEFLSKPKHNVLAYTTTPTFNLALFGAYIPGQGFISDYETLKGFAEGLSIDIVPLLYKGKIDTVDGLHKLLETESFLGGPKIEGVVVKNYSQPFLLGGQPIPIMMGKYVSEAFKEIHRKNWGAEHTGQGRWDVYKSQFRTEARWQKAVQHLKEKGEIEGEPRDIGKLMKEVSLDIIAEEKEAILKVLWEEFGKEVVRVGVHGLAEWYKNELVKKAFENESSGKS
jgi:hypothetical protein